MFWYKNQRTKKKSAFVYGGLSILFFILFGVTSDIKDTSSNTLNSTDKETKQRKGSHENQIDAMPTEQKLAILDATTYVEVTDIKVIRIKILLDDLAKQYNQPKDTIAEYTSKAQGVLHDKGIEETCLNILEEMHKADKIENTSYKDAVTYYLMMHENE